ncbi:heavy-metal-associated domain-containing protein [Carnobacteriaceae bacterium 52-44]
MNQVTLQLEKLTCPSCMQKITATINNLKGVDKMKILFNSSKARVFFNEDSISDQEIIEKIQEIGYDAEKI